MTFRTFAVTVFASLLILASCSDGGDATSGDSGDDSGQEESTTGDPSNTDPSSATPTNPGPSSLTPQGLGEVTIGMSEANATDSGLIEGEWTANCEIAEGGETFALLAAPPTGQVYALDGSVSAILVLDESVSTEPGGVAVGMSRDEATAAFAAEGLTMTVDESTAEAFGTFFWSASDGDTAVFGGSIDPDAGVVTAIATPRIPLCD